MSNYISISSPFLKRVHLSNTGSRRETNPLFGSTFQEVVPSTKRRIFLLIQNNTDAAAELYLDLEGDDVAGSNVGVKLYPNQSITFDNYNGGFFVNNYGTTGEIVIGESFA